ncbi:LmbU family transcriptional regulator [Nocardia sp. NPDC060256]|uniref:LmbU family transcriptional regulator n=1 Tax=unclassified Nocardia TaxID=2637762 RepID=UPI003669B245
MHVTRVGLRIRSPLSYSTWEHAGIRLADAHNSSAWCLGDWLVYGEDRFEGRYRKAINEVKLDYQTLRNYAWVVRRFPLERRKPNLSFQHHAEVAALPPEKQEFWLERAERFGWSRNQLRGYLRGGEGKGPLPSPAKVLGGISVSKEQLSRWMDAAERETRPLADWVLAHLDGAAAEVLDY